jgi:sporulation protein YlmC with PRC-barrel domain
MFRPLAVYGLRTNHASEDILVTSRFRTLTVALTLAVAVPALPGAAQVAGSVNLASSSGDVKVIALGYRATKLLHSPVYNADGHKIGEVDDLVVAPNTFVSYVIVGVGGFLGLGQKDVAVPARDFKIINKKVVLAGATKKALESLPAFHFSTL